MKDHSNCDDLCFHKWMKEHPSSDLHDDEHDVMDPLCLLHARGERENESIRCPLCRCARCGAPFTQHPHTTDGYYSEAPEDCPGWGAKCPVAECQNPALPGEECQAHQATADVARWDADHPDGLISPQERASLDAHEIPVDWVPLRERYGLIEQLAPGEREAFRRIIDTPLDEDELLRDAFRFCEPSQPAAPAKVDASSSQPPSTENPLAEESG